MKKEQWITQYSNYIGSVSAGNNDRKTEHKFKFLRCGGGGNKGRIYIHIQCKAYTKKVLSDTKRTKFPNFFRNWILKKVLSDI